MTPRGAGTTASAAASRIRSGRGGAGLGWGDLLKEKLDTPEAIAQLVDTVKNRVRRMRPTVAADRENLGKDLADAQRRLVWQ